MKRTYDPRKVKRHRSYTVKRLAKLYDVQPNTVRQWIKKHDLPVIEGSYPVLMHWQDIREWMTDWQAARKWTCADDEMSCFTCNGPRKIKPGTFKITQDNTKKVMVQGDCEICGQRINRASSPKKLHINRTNFTPNAGSH